MTGGSVTVRRARPDTLDAVLDKLTEAGATITTTADSVTWTCTASARARST